MSILRRAILDQQFAALSVQPALGKQLNAFGPRSGPVISCPLSIILDIWESYYEIGQFHILSTYGGL